MKTEWERFVNKVSKSEACRELMKSVNTMHLKHMIENIARKPDTNIDLRESPLSDLTPAETYELLEDLGWKEGDCLIDRHYTVFSFYHNDWGFSICLSFDGFFGYLNLYREEEVE